MGSVDCLWVPIDGTYMRYYEKEKVNEVYYFRYSAGAVPERSRATMVPEHLHLQRNGIGLRSEMLREIQF